MGWTRMIDAVRAIAVAIAVLAASCSDFHAKESEGGETHFLRECDDDKCPSGLECVCGVCTNACVGDAVCAALDGEATCVSLETESLECKGPPPAARICDNVCVDSADCEPLGDDFECLANRCRPHELAGRVAANVTDAGDPSALDASLDAEPFDCEDGALCGDVEDPLVLIIVDTSGSMERRTDCACTTASCTECLPTCSQEQSDKNRWAQVLEALTGTFDNFSCEAIDRDNPDEYDFDYAVPYHKPIGAQRRDGILQEYASDVRFGIATFDTVSSYGRDEQRSPEEFDFDRSLSEAGLWSYPPATDLVEVEERDDGMPVGQIPIPWLSATLLRGHGNSKPRCIVGCVDRGHGRGASRNHPRTDALSALGDTALRRHADRCELG
jgi:hypothetical protein